MQHNITSRLILIIGVLVASLWILWPEAWKVVLLPFNSKTEIKWAPNLEQGLDMKGGVSLIYQIKAAAGQVVSADLSQNVANALKTRIDPNGVRNLIWRPQGADRLEIQLPAGEVKPEDKKVRDDFLAAERDLKEINTSAGTVLAVLDLPDAATRQQQIDQIAQGSQIRRDLINRLVNARETKSKLDAKWKTEATTQPTTAPAGTTQPSYGPPEAELDAYINAEDALQPNAFGEELEKTNVDIQKLQQAVDFTDKIERQRRIDEIRNSDPSFASRIQKIDAYMKAYAAFKPIEDKVDSVASLKGLLRGSGVLTFNVVANPNDPQLPARTFETYQKRLQTDGPRFRPGDQFRWYKYGDQSEPTKMVEEEGRREPYIAKYNGEYYLLVWITDDKAMINREGGNKPKWALTGAKAVQDSNTVKTVISFQFDPQGGVQFGDLTGRHKPGTPGAPYMISAILDDVVVSAANINDQIGASGQISGGGKTGFDQAQAQYMEKTLSAGALPAQLESEPIVERVIGPQLGRDNLNRGLLACSAGVIVVAIFLITYYLLSGCVATVAVMLNVLLILAGMSAFGATFTLPGVAGIILTIGMAVDANVLIFERLREEQQRGLGIRVALHRAYDRAMSAIVDSNITTGICAIVLYLIGTEEVKGFGLTLLLGIVSSMFTALFVTRTIFYILTEKFGIEKLTSLPLRYPKLDKALRPHIDWLKLAPFFIVFSTVFIVGGMILFGMVWKANKLFDIEFAGGTAITIELKNADTIENIRKTIEEKAKTDPTALPAVNVTSVGDSASLTDTRYKSYEIVTPNTNRTAVMNAISSAFTGKLNVAEPIRFDDSTASIDTIVPGENNDRTSNQTRAIGILTGNEAVEGNFHPDGMDGYIGGVAFVLENVKPHLEPRQIEERLDQERLLKGANSGFRSISVQRLPDGVGVVVLALDANNLYKGDAASLRQIAKPMWDQIVTGLTAPAEFQRVSGIDQSVAAQARDSAVSALIASIVFIVIYIWVRFGDMKYGTATIIALIHDCFFALAAIGFAHVMADNIVGRALMIDPFRINLTVVSGLLTILGFSMNDTVVVFDRIRELRGQRGHLDRNVINDAINQTLSRTILTGATTVATILFMYVLGGEAIHGFTYALFVGFLAGTYSSVAVAAPLLLVGIKKAKTPAPVRKPTPVAPVVNP